MWFESLTGFTELNPNQVRANLELDGEWLTSRANGRRMRCGSLETPSLGELRERTAAARPSKGNLRTREVIADVGRLHTDPAHAGALFQVASQFNCLEMMSPGVTPERGIDIYEKDRTQGPVCAMACGAATIYRNYLAAVGNQIGQTSQRQIDCLEDLGHALDNREDRLWQMRNGYALASEDGLLEVATRLDRASEADRDDLRRRLRIGVQWNCEVTRDDAGHTVSQVFGSALPVSYTDHSPQRWMPFARLVLEASYEAALHAACLNPASNQVFLTLLGGGVFGNHIDWIIDAMRRALNYARDVDLDVAIVSYGQSHPHVRDLISSL